MEGGGGDAPRVGLLSSSMVSLVSGGLAGAVADATVHPLDTVKVKMQAQTSRSALQFRSTAHALQYTVRHEGLRGIYQGLGPMLMGSVPANALFFGSYEFFKRALSSPRLPFSPESPLVHLSAGALGQVVALSVCVPFDIIKSRMQVSGRSRLLVDSITAMSQAQDPLHERRIARTVHGTTGASSEGLHPSSSSASAAADASHKGASSPSSTPAYRYRNTGHALQDIVRTDGFRGLYRGFGATLLRDGPWSALQFCFYESARSLLQNSADHELQVSSGKEVSLPAWKGLLAGLMAGTGAAICTTPLDTIKTRLQTQQNAEGMAGEYRYAGISDAFRTIVREEGVRGGLFRGIMPRIYYIAPFTAVAFACLESFKTFFGAL